MGKFGLPMGLDRHRTVGPSPAAIRYRRGGRPGCKYPSAGLRFESAFFTSLLFFKSREPPDRLKSSGDPTAASDAGTVPVSCNAAMGDKSAGYGKNLRDMRGQAWGNVPNVGGDKIRLLTLINPRFFKNYSHLHRFLIRVRPNRVIGSAVKVCEICGAPEIALGRAREELQRPLRGAGRGTDGVFRDL